MLEGTMNGELEATVRADSSETKCPATALRPQKPVLTISLIALNVFIFLVMTAVTRSTKSSVLVFWGGLGWPTFQQGDYAALLTSAFVHIGMAHLLVNMLALWFLGKLLEGFLGTARFALVYYTSALTASLLSICFIHGAVSAGASGAIFGIVGAMFALGLQYRHSMPAQMQKICGRRAIPFFVCELVLDLVVPHINILAHLGGAAGGAVCAYALAPHEDRKWTRRLATGGALAVTFLAFCYHFVFFIVLVLGIQQLARPRAAMASGNIAAARDQLDELAPKHRRDPMYHALNAEWFETEGQYTEAESEYRLGLHEAPADSKIRHSFGLLLWKEGKIDAAAGQLRQAAKADSHDARIHFDLGRLLLARGAYDAAVVEFQKAVRLAPNQAAEHRALASALLLAGQNAQAKVESEAADRLQAGRGQ